MKKTINMLGWVSVFITILALVCTILTTYHFTYIKYFNDYYTLQWCLFFTMLIWGIKTFDIKASLNNIMYTIICILMAAGTIFFMYMKVY
ncbi:hypothetical protein [Clostridium omnivorum]|uniref:Uncharacterized protein n=1 Tax=Clostridium omnivorum TaxID=1604902 RepID=A0ABQ5N8M0_9CLOT|nr:hypothetical protein [Clostridium sp. E14]GLC31434.1 hypothetical protein bsdE14_28440 [Clostridium sp. E14]